MPFVCPHSFAYIKRRQTIEASVNYREGKLAKKSRHILHRSIHLDGYHRDRPMDVWEYLWHLLLLLGKSLAYLVVGLGLIAFGGVLVMLVWNAVVPDVFGLPRLIWQQAFLLLVLVNLIQPVNFMGMTKGLIRLVFPHLGEPDDPFDTTL